MFYNVLQFYVKAYLNEMFLQIYDIYYMLPVYCLRKYAFL